MHRARAVRHARVHGWLLLAAFTAGCGSPAPPEWHQEDGFRWTELDVPRHGRDGFRRLSPGETGITFVNSVTEQQVLENEHVLNGSGVALGDVDGDGRPDVYFTRLHGPNVLYRNLGDWRFEDVTDRAGVAAAGRFSTGAVLADVDGDGDLDLLVTSLGGPHALYINDGQGIFADRTAESGLASGYYGTTMTLADVDGDGDLDLYVANNKVRTVRDMYPPWDLEFDRVVEEVNGEYVVQPEFRDHYRVVVQRDRVMRFEYAEPDKFYLNDGSGRFQEVSFTSGRFLDEAGEPLADAPRDWGLAARFYDVNGDGAPDLYVCNDFESPDRLWINDGSGGFRLVNRLALRVTSYATMAIDFADIDRDGDVDFFAVDMLDLSSARQKTQRPAEAPERPGPGDIDTRLQLPRNTLFINRGDATFAEAARFAGLEASGWSWSVMFLDVDLDGYEDVLIGNGHARDFLDADTKARLRRVRDAGWRRARFLYPELKLENVAFRNNGDLTFERVSEAWGLGPDRDITHGMATADLDGDGDQDVVTNRLDAPAGVYRNESTGTRIAVRLAGRPPNTQGIGAKIRVVGGPVPQTREVTSGGMYLSSSDPVYTFAAADADSLTILVEWRDGGESQVTGARPNRLYEIQQTGAAHPQTPTVADGAASENPYFEDHSTELAHDHIDTAYNDFARQPLLPNRLSQLGPGVTWADLDRDGDEDLLISPGGGGRLAYYRNDNGSLRRITLPIAEARLDQTTVLPLPDADGRTVLLLGQMNYEARSPADAVAAPAVLRVEPGGGGWRAPASSPRLSPAVPGIMSSTGHLALADYDRDGDLDLFVGGRVLPARYPLQASSRLFRNEAGTFVLDTANTRALSEVGLVSSAIFSDVDRDGDADLVLALEWGPVTLFLNHGGRFIAATDAWGLSRSQSRWNGITAGDLDGDGLPDLITTSWGRNTAHRARPDRPLRVYHGDFDGNGRFDVILAQYDARLGAEVPLVGLAELAVGLPFMARRIGSFRAYADATIEDVLERPVTGVPALAATTFDHTVWFNRGGRFEGVPLPAPAQLAPSFYAGVADFDGDGNEDVFLTQNFFPTAAETQRYAAGRGLWLRGDGRGGLDPVPGTLSGITVYGDQRGAALSDFDGDARVDLVISQNANATRLYRNARARPGLRVRLRGPDANPDAIGATVRLVYGEGRGPAREIRAGSGHWSHDGPVQVMGMAARPTGVWVRWPDGTESETPVPGGALEITIEK